MTEENIDPDQEFSIQDSTEEFETGEESSNDYQPADTDFDQDSAVAVQDYDQENEPADNQTFSDTPDISEPYQRIEAPAPISEPEQKTPSPQSFRVMRFEDFVSQPND